MRLPRGQAMLDHPMPPSLVKGFFGESQAASAFRRRRLTVGVPLMLSWPWAKRRHHLGLGARKSALPEAPEVAGFFGESKAGDTSCRRRLTIRVSSC
jgi:hypothetical protein